MSGKLTMQPAAEADLEEHADYLAKHNLQVALRFSIAAQETIAGLVEAPMKGSLRGFRNPSLADVRHWPVRGFRNYIIYYRPTAEGIEVLRVLYSARNAARILNS